MVWSRRVSNSRVSEAKGRDSMQTPACRFETSLLAQGTVSWRAGLSKKQSGKKARKKSKRKKDGVAADFEEAAATPDAGALKQQQSDTLEVLFEIFFRVLKQTAASGLTALERKGESFCLTRAVQGCQSHFKCDLACEGCSVASAV